MNFRSPQVATRHINYFKALFDSVYCNKNSFNQNRFPVPLSIPLALVVTSGTGKW